MSTTVTIEEAHARLPELVAHLAGGEELIITQDDKPVARLVREGPPRQPRKPGTCKGMITLLVEDDDHLEGFAIPHEATKEGVPGFTTAPHRVAATVCR